MRIGILGGTFDPVHIGHLVVAEECRAKLDLDRVLFVPAGQPPHKRFRRVSPMSDRVAMVELAIVGNSAFALSRVEVDRVGLSYTVDTLARLRQEFGPETELLFIVGMDALSEMLTWYQPARILELSKVIAVTRPGIEEFDPASLESDLPGAGRRVRVLAAPELRISSSDLRARVGSGQPIRYQVPEAVEAYINERGLYRGYQEDSSHESGIHS